jgi:mRNA-degrading endonuclease toxin of MazEF toxin-antitoxin module
VTAQRILARVPSVVQVVPLTRTIRGYTTEVTVAADDHMAFHIWHASS